MAFRNHLFRPSPPASDVVFETFLKQSCVDGVDVFTPVDVDARSKPTLPSADDYRLSALLQSGSPLNYVSPTIYEYPDLDADHFVNTFLAPEDIQEVPRETDDNQIDTNND